MKTRRLLLISLIVIVVGSAAAYFIFKKRQRFGGLAMPADVSEAVTWYDTLGFPDARDLPYVRVATGGWIEAGNRPPQAMFAEGFLVSEEADAFKVFLCSVFGNADYAPLTTVRFVRKNSGPAYRHVGFEVLDFDRASFDALDQVRRDSNWGHADRSGAFAFARACLQKERWKTASALMSLMGDVLDDQTGEPVPWTLRETLQRQFGHAVLRKATMDWGNPEISWAELLKVYAGFETRFPASPEVNSAREAAALVRMMIDEEKAHHPKPLEQMSPAEQAVENIYLLRYFAENYWSRERNYSNIVSAGNGKAAATPVSRLVGLGYEAVPQLIEALDDRCFTRTMTPRFNGAIPPAVTRVGDFAQQILEHVSGRNFFPRRTGNGRIPGSTTRQQAEAWWAEVQSNDERQVLIKATALGAEDGCVAARKLAAEYPHAAIDAIETGFGLTADPDLRGEYVEVAGTLPGEIPVAFLQSKLGPGNGLYAQVNVAEALFARGKPEAVPAMIDAWRIVQPRLSANESDAFSEVGGLIAFLAKSGDAAAINALGRDIRKAPVEVRLAVVEVFMPWQERGTEFLKGRSVHVLVDMPKLPAGEAGAAIERLLAAALDDTERRFGMKKYYYEASIDSPRVCDMAALVLSRRWPEKYRFQWIEDPLESEAQIARIRDQWREERSVPNPSPARAF